MYIREGQILFDLTFFVFDMLAHDWVVFARCHFLGHCACVFLGHIEVARARRGVQADFNRGRLRHGVAPWTALVGARIRARDNSVWALLLTGRQVSTEKRGNKRARPRHNHKNADQAHLLPQQ